MKKVVTVLITIVFISIMVLSFVGVIYYKNENNSIEKQNTKMKVDIKKMKKDSSKYEEEIKKLKEESKEKLEELEIWQKAEKNVKKEK